MSFTIINLDAFALKMRETAIGRMSSERDERIELRAMLPLEEAKAIARPLLIKRHDKISGRVWLETTVTRSIKVVNALINLLLEKTLHDLAERGELERGYNSETGEWWFLKKDGDETAG